MIPPRETMDYDVLIVGAGLAGLSAAVRLKQLAAAQGRQISVCVIEKGAEIGAHSLSGAVFEPRALAELFPDWQQRGAPLHTPVRKDGFLLLTRQHAIPLPTPASLNNHGNYIISLCELTRWLAGEAEQLGVEIYPGFAGAEILYGENGRVLGVGVGDCGVNKQGEKTPAYVQGMALRARHTLFAEGCRGSLTKQLIARFDLAKGAEPQTYGLGIKEVWEISAEKHQPGFVLHTAGWPLDSNTYGGGWVYHYGENLVSIGMVVGLDYQNPFLSPFAEMQRFKHHPSIARLLQGGKRVGYGARALSEGGWQAIPKLSFPGGLLVGDAAGFLNVAKIKGNHTAMKSGMVAAEAVFAQLDNEEVTQYPEKLKESWLYQELYAVRNIRPAFHYGLWAGLLYAGLDLFLLRGRTPWTFHHRPDHRQLKPAAQMPRIAYPKPDGIISFDKLSSVYLSNTNHREDQPCHLQLLVPEQAISLNHAVYDSPETRYCPAGVYEMVMQEDGAPHLHINGQNCIHCKSCDIKDPGQNINWVTPEGGGGPRYGGM